jgi:PilZ domain
MTPEMAFECLLVTADPAVLSPMADILQDFSIATKRCVHPIQASPMLQDGSTDLIVIDLEADKSSEFLQQLGRDTPRQKPTVLAVAASDCLVPGVHVILRKPVTAESGMASLKAAYTRMVRDYRKYTRFAVMSQVVATDDEKRAIRVTVTNIGAGGIGLTTNETLEIGRVLYFRLRLPELKNEILIQARVLWTRPYGSAGCEFVHMPSFDFKLLQAWLDSRYRVKKPLIFI